MADASLTQTLLSGAIGALGTAALGYLVQARLADRTKRREEQNMAYVHFTRISTILAAGEFAKIYGKVYSPLAKGVIDTIKKESGLEADFAHAAAVIVYSVVKAGGDPDLDDVRRSARVFAGQVQDFLDFQIPPEQLAKLPRKAIVYYGAFVDASRSIMKSIELLSRALNGDEELEPLDLFLFWEQIKRYHSICVTLGDLLRTYGDISKEEANRVLAVQKGLVAKSISAKKDAEPKILALVPIVEKIIKANQEKAAGAAQAAAQAAEAAAAEGEYAAPAT